MYGGGVMAGRRAGSDVGKYSTMPRAQNRAAKGSILYTKTIHFTHLGILFIAMLLPVVEPGGSLDALGHVDNHLVVGATQHRPHHLAQLLRHTHHRVDHL